MGLVRTRGEGSTRKWPSLTYRQSPGNKARLSRVVRSWALLQDLLGLAHHTNGCRWWVFKKALRCLQCYVELLLYRRDRCCSRCVITTRIFCRANLEFIRSKCCVWLTNRGALAVDCLGATSSGRHSPRASLWPQLHNCWGKAYPVRRLWQKRRCAYVFRGICGGHLPSTAHSLHKKGFPNCH